MRLALVAGISLSGWFMAGTYVLYEYREYGKFVADHFFTYQDPFITFFHLLMLFTPLASTAMGYLVNERMVGEIKKLEERYRDYYDNAPCGYHSVGGDFTLLDVNDTWLKMLGYRKDEVVGRMKVTDLVDGAGMEVFKKSHAGLLKTGKAKGIKMEFRRKDGGMLPVLVSSTAAYGESGGFIRSRTIVEDDARRRNYEEALRTVAEEWKETFDSMPWGVMLLDGNLGVIKANRYVSTLTGLSPADLASTKCAELVRAIEDGEGAGKGADGAGMIEYSEPDSGRAFRLYGRQVKADGQFFNHVISLVDITDIKQGEKKLLDSRDAFFNMLKDANAAYTELNELHSNLVLAFANAIDAKSPWTKGHSERVTRYATALAREAGLSGPQLAELRTAALLHDIGKIGTYDYLLDKPSGLTPEEFDIVKKHPLESVAILEPISRFGPIIDIIKHHHEHYDGSGYPTGIGGEKIPLMARVLCIADCYDSMTADRPYRSALEGRYAMEEIRKCSGAHFDPELVEVFLRMFEGGLE